MFPTDRLVIVAGVGRPKSYDPEVVTRKAMELFWQRGFHATPTKDLAAHMGINVYSLFAEFGSKQGLFESALALYGREVVAEVLGPLEAPGAGIEELVAVFESHVSDASGPDADQGCLMCNTATERARNDPMSHDLVEAYFTRIQRAICHALDNAQAKGDVRPDVVCEDESRLLTATLLGFAVLMRAGVDREIVTGAARAVGQNLARMRSLDKGPDDLDPPNQIETIEATEEQ